MDIRIRPAVLKDIDALVAFDHVAQQSPQRALLIRSAIETSRCAVAEVAGQVAGFLITNDSFFGQHFVDLIYVARSHRRAGVGESLLAHAEARCEREKLFTSTNQSNTPMQMLLRKRGYEPSGHIDHLDEGDRELVYVKRGLCVRSV